MIVFMESVIRSQLMPHTFLTYVRTGKFKTSCLSVSLVTQLSRDTAAKNALLPKVLRRGTSRHPDLDSIAAALDNLFGARIEPVVRKKGELHCIGFFSDFVGDEYVPAGENVLEKTAALMGEMLLSPDTRGGQLRSEYVDSEKSVLIDEIRAGVNDKRRYSVDKLVELMFDSEDYGTNKLGSESSARAITAAGLTKHYRKVIAESRIEVFYCGSAAFDRVSAAILDALATLPRNDQIDDITTDIRLSPAMDQPRRYFEQLDVTQGKLAIGFRLGQSMKAPNYAALMVFNSVFGGSVTSKLFLNVREKLSLCYFASSILEKHKGIMIVSSGVDFDKYKEALDEILIQLQAVQSGEISDWELTSARRAVVTSIKSALDKPSGLEELYFDQAVSDIKCTPDELAALAETVTKEDVRKIAEGVQPDTIYFLSGPGGDVNEAERI